MGHSHSAAYLAYAAKQSVIDFQAIARGIEEDDVLHLSSMGLGMRADAPKLISEGGFQRALADSQYRQLDDKVADLMDQLRLAYGSLKSAEQASDRRFAEYTRLQQSRSSRLRIIVSRIYREEYIAFFEKEIIARPRSAEIEAVEDEDEDSLFIPEFAVDPDRELSLWVDNLNIEAKAGDHLGNEINPTLTGESANFIENLRRAAEELDEDPTMEDVDSHQTNTTELHGIYTCSQRLRAGSQRSFVPAKLPLSNLYEDVLGREDEISNEELAALLIPAYAIMHPLDRFPIHWMPQPGTQICRFCLKDHCRKCWRSVFNCAEKDVLQRAQSVWDEQIKKLTSCPFILPDGSGCRTAITNPKKLSMHVHLTHAVPMKHSLLCHFCSADGVRFDSVASLIDHWIADHDYIPYSQSPCLFMFCAFCEDTLWEVDGSSAREKHFAGHLEEAYMNIKKYGYNGIAQTQRTVVPIIDPFLFHDATLPVSKRLFVYKGGIVYGLKEGLRLRAAAIRRMLEASGEDRRRCPISISAEADYALCTEEKSMTMQELMDHMKASHGVDYSENTFPTKKNTKRKSKAKGHNQSDIEGSSGSGSEILSTKKQAKRTAKSKRKVREEQLVSGSSDSDTALIRKPMKRTTEGRSRPKRVIHESSSESETGA